MLLCMFLSVITGANTVRIIELSSPIYQYMDMLAVSSGDSLPSTSRPWSEDEALKLLEMTDRQTLSLTEKDLYDRVYEMITGKEYLFDSDESVKIDLGLTANAEMYYHTNEEHFNTERDWVYGYDSRKPVAHLQMDWAMHEWFHTYCELEYNKNHFAEEDETDDVLEDSAVRSLIASYLYNDTFSTNFFKMKHVDFETPYRAYAAVGGDGWNLQMGRDDYSWGPGKTGNFIIDSHLDFYDAIRFVSYHNNFKYEVFYSFFDYSQWDDDSDSYDFNETASNGMEMFLTHRLEFTPVNWLSFAISENVMYEHSFIDLRYLNPAYIFHNLNNRDMFNAIASAEVNVTPIEHLNIYAQFVLDQARAPLEDSSQPGAYGYMLGAAYQQVSARWLQQSHVEIVYTDPYLYHRDGVDFIVDQRHFIIGAEDYIVPYIDYIGYQYGSDTIAAEIGTSFTNLDAGTFSATLTGLLQGEVDIDTVISDHGDYDFGDQLSPSGTEITQMLILTADAQIPIPQIQWLRAWSSLSLIAMRTYDRDTDTSSAIETDLQCVIGMSVTL